MKNFDFVFLKMLILFDVNGILCFKSYTELVDVRKEDFINAASYLMILRPGIRELLKRLGEKHTLGIFSSTTFKNVIPVIKELEKSGIKFAITAYREYTQLDPDFLQDKTIQPFDTIKRLETIWSHPFFNMYRVWSRENTLLIDDSKIKTRFIDPANVLIWPSFNHEEYLKGCHADDLEQDIELAVTNLQLTHVHVGSSSSSVEKSDSLEKEPTQSSSPGTSRESH